MESVSEDGGVEERLQYFQEVEDDELTEVQT